MGNTWLSLVALHSCKEARLSLQFNNTFLFLLALQEFHMLAIAFQLKSDTENPLVPWTVHKPLPECFWYYVCILLF